MYSKCYCLSIFFIKRKLLVLHKALKFYENRRYDFELHIRFSKFSCLVLLDDKNVAHSVQSINITVTLTLNVSYLRVLMLDSFRSNASFGFFKAGFEYEQLNFIFCFSAFFAFGWESIRYSCISKSCYNKIITLFKCPISYLDIKKTIELPVLSEINGKGNEMGYLRIN